MAGETAFGTNDPRTQKHWSKKTFKYALDNMWLTKVGFMGAGPESIIQVDKSIQEIGVGDTVTFELEAPLSGAGQGDDGTMVGNSETMVTHNFKVDVHERLHSVQSNGPISELRTATKIRESGKRRLGIWSGQALENDVMRSIYGLQNNGIVLGTVNDGIGSTNGSIVHSQAIDTTRHYMGGQTTGGVLKSTLANHAAMLAVNTAAELFGTRVIDLAKALAIEADPQIRPIMVDGEPKYVMLINIWQEWALRAEAAWNTAQQSANVRGRKNPIFSGAIGEWNGVIIHVYHRAPMRGGVIGGGASVTDRSFAWNDAQTANKHADDLLPDTVYTARAVLLGQQAGVLGWGMPLTWKEDPYDAGRKPVVGVDMIYAAAKTKFNLWNDGGQSNTAQSDFGVITMDTQVVPQV